MARDDNTPGLGGAGKSWSRGRELDVGTLGAVVRRALEIVLKPQHLKRTRRISLVVGLV